MIDGTGGRSTGIRLWRILDLIGVNGVICGFGEFLGIHASYYFINVGGRQMGTSLRHLGGLVPQHFADR